MISRTVLTRAVLTRAGKVVGKTALRTPATVRSNALTPLGLNVRFLATKIDFKKPVGLSQVLEAEIFEEANNEVDDLKSVDATAVLKHFKMTETLGNGIVTLTRQFKNEEITITFDCQDESEGAGDDEMYDGDNKDESEPDIEDEDYDENAVYGINFNISIKKPSGELILDCVAEEGVSVLGARLSKGTYSGPPFENLSDELVEAFNNYLEDRKIDSHLSNFILETAASKEQREYVRWLQELKKFTDSA